jgi:uncharacterized cupin superfamily protein
MTHIARLSRDGVTPDIQRPDPAKVLHGDPVHSTWNLEERDGLYCGLWQSTPGAWRIRYDEWEYVRILEGLSILHEDGAPPVTLRAGDSAILRPGLAGVWEVVETTLKEYVIRT